MPARGRRQWIRGSGATSVAPRRRSQGEGGPGGIHGASSRGGTPVPAVVRSPVAGMPAYVVSERASVQRENGLPVNPEYQERVRQEGTQGADAVRGTSGAAAGAGFRQQFRERGRRDDEDVVDGGLLAYHRQDAKRGRSDGLKYPSISNLSIHLGAK